MIGGDWMNELQALAVKCGVVVTDLDSLTLAEAWGLLQFLRRVVGDSDAG